MSDDRELLKLAAKAVGIEIYKTVEECVVQLNPEHIGGFAVWNERGGHSLWNPLLDDGDEARLEAVLGLNVAWDFVRVKVGNVIEFFDRNHQDYQKARRRAGVRAAAEIGRQMK